MLFWENESFLRFLRLLGEKCPINHHSRMSLMTLCTYVVPHSLESTFELIISFEWWICQWKLYGGGSFTPVLWRSKCWLRKAKWFPFIEVISCKDGLQSEICSWFHDTFQICEVTESSVLYPCYVWKIEEILSLWWNLLDLLFRRVNSHMKEKMFLMDFQSCLHWKVEWSSLLLHL